MNEEDKLLLIVIKYSLKLEKFISQNLNQLLFIENPNNSRLFKKNGGLTSRNKIDILYDLNYIEKVPYQNIILQLEIRNVFVHNDDVKSFEDCFNFFSENTQKNKLLGFKGETYLDKFMELSNNNLDSLTSIINNESKRITERVEYIKRNEIIFPEVLNNYFFLLEDLMKLSNNKNDIDKTEIQNLIEKNLTKISHYKEQIGKYDSDFLVRLVKKPLI